MSDINQPCIRRCRLNVEDICLGCFRSFNDMRQWSKASVEEKQKMLNIAQTRKREHGRKETSSKK